MGMGSDRTIAELPRFVLRRIQPCHVIPHSKTIDPVAFRIRKNESDLSVFNVESVTPSDLLQRAIDGFLRKEQRGDKGATRWLEQNGRTPQAMVEAGWRVVRINTDEFVQAGFRVGEVAESGHISIYGTAAKFEEYSYRFVEVCVIVEI